MASGGKKKRTVRASSNRKTPVAKPRKSLDQLSPAYRKRLERALAKGKTRQEARGHRAGEARVRKQREREAYGISGADLKAIEAWEARYRNEGRSLDDLVEFAISNGYDAFVKYRETWNAARRLYLKELKNETYSSRGLQYLEMLTAQAGVTEISWLYYH